MMNLISGMTAQQATIIDSGKASPHIMKRLAGIFYHLADMMNYAPAYMMGSTVVASKIFNKMQGMLLDLEKCVKKSNE